MLYQVSYWRHNKKQFLIYKTLKGAERSAKKLKGLSDGFKRVSLVPIIITWVKEPSTLPDNLILEKDEDEDV